MSLKKKGHCGKGLFPCSEPISSQALANLIPQMNPADFAMVIPLTHDPIPPDVVKDAISVLSVPSNKLAMLHIKDAGALLIRQDLFERAFAPGMGYFDLVRAFEVMGYYSDDAIRR